MSDEQRDVQAEVVGGPMTTMRVRLRPDGSWPPSVILEDMEGRDRMGFRHLGDGRYAFVPAEHIWFDRFEARDPEPYTVEGDDVWPKAIVVERVQRTSVGERRIVERRSYIPDPAGATEKLRDLDEPREFTPPEIERMRQSS